MAELHHSTPTIAKEMEQQLSEIEWDARERLVLTCRMLAADGHSSGLAGQISFRVGDGTFWTAPFGSVFEEITLDDLVRIDDDLAMVEGSRLPNPAIRFHLWIYRKRPEVNCIIHTHPPYASALSMLGQELVVSHMDATPLYDDCAFLPEWPGVPVADHEGEIISEALGDKRAILLAHHGQLVASSTIEEAATLAICIERAARIQLLAQAAGAIRPIPEALAREAHDFLLKPSIVNATFGTYARRVLLEQPDCLGVVPEEVGQAGRGWLVAE